MSVLPTFDGATDSGVVVVDKPGGMTSHDVVARIRRLAGTRKVGHAGTLDPMATGVLVVGINRATRLLGHLQQGLKAYDAIIRLGISTSTDDAEGDPLPGPDRSLEAADLDETVVRRGVGAYLGSISQVPSSVSAVKVGGRRAHARVRAGETVELAAREVRVESLVVHALRPAAACLDVEVSVRCSSGTYIRALARDIGADLGVGGHLRALRRTAVGPFDLSQARSLADLGERLAPLPLGDAARSAFLTRDLSEDEAGDVRVGRPLRLSLSPEGVTAVFDPGGEFLALYAMRDERARAVAVFV